MSKMKTLLAAGFGLVAASSFAADYPSGYSKCADQGGTCTVKNAPNTVAYGIKDKWVYKYVGSSTVACTTEAFGSDPYPGVNKKCSYNAKTQIGGGTATPTPTRVAATATPTPTKASATPTPITATPTKVSITATPTKVSVTPTPTKISATPTAVSGVMDAATLNAGLIPVDPVYGTRTYAAPATDAKGLHSPSNYKAAPKLPTWQFATVDPTGGKLTFERETAPMDGWHSWSRQGKVLVTGGSSAASNRIYTVFNKEQLLAAIRSAGNEPKIIRVVGHIDFRWDNGVFKEYTSFDDQKKGGSLQIPSNTTLVGINDAQGRPARITGTQILIGIEKALTTGGDAEADFKTWVAQGKDQESFPTWTRNVILRNLAIDTPWDVNPEDSGNAYMDGIAISRAAHVWIDHITVSDGDTPDSLASDTRHDGALDVVRGSDYVTVTQSVFSKHHKTSLIGNSDSGRAWSDGGRLHVTLSNNWWNYAGTRLPLARHGQVHMYNNVVTGSTTTSDADLKFEAGLDVRYNANVLVQNMFYEFTGLKDSEACGKVIKGKSGIAFAASGLRFVSDKGSAPNAVIDINLSSCGGVGSANIFTPPYSYALKTADAARDAVKANAGAGKLK